MLWAATIGCDSKPSTTATTQAGPSGAKPEATPGKAAVRAATGPVPTRKTRFDAPKRVVAIGDVHGDLQATRAALRLAGAIGSDSDTWIGADLVVVQTGDQLDRGDDEQAILDLFETLVAQAESAGGAVHVLNGNHEFMNVAGDLRYVTEGGLADFEGVPGLNVADARVTHLPPKARARMAAFVPGGPYASVLAKRNTVVIVGRTVFVHGGVLPQHVAKGVPDLDKLNADARAWLWGKADGADAIAAQIMAPDSVVWTRVYAGDDAKTCETLVQTLNLLDADRLVVGHTVQQAGITSGCDERLWRIDVGMAKHYGGKPQVLAIDGDTVRVVGS